jgi:hypothetical protein
MWASFGHPSYEGAGCLGVVGWILATAAVVFFEFGGFWGFVLPGICFVAPFLVYLVRWDFERWREKNRDDQTPNP